jgi:hypothetical protein
MALNKQHRIEASPDRVSVEEPIRFDTLPGLTQQNLYKLADAVIGVVPDEQRSWIIRTSELHLDSSALEIVDEVRHWAARGSKFLYYLQVMGQPDLNVRRCSEFT